MKDILSTNDFLSLVDFHSTTSLMPDEKSIFEDVEESIASIESILRMCPEFPAPDYSLDDLHKLCSALYRIPLLCDTAPKKRILNQLMRKFRLAQLFSQAIDEEQSSNTFCPEKPLFLSFIACYCYLNFAVMLPEKEVLPSSNNEYEQIDSIAPNDFQSEPSKQTPELINSKSELSSYMPEDFNEINSRSTNGSEDFIHQQLSQWNFSERLDDILGEIHSYFLSSYSAKTIEMKNHLDIIRIFSNLLAAILAFLIHPVDNPKNGIYEHLRQFLSVTLPSQPNNISPGKAYILNQILLRRFYIAARITDPTIIDANIYPESTLSITRILRPPDAQKWSPALMKELINMADSILGIQTALTVYKLPAQLVYYTSLSTFHYLLPQKHQIDQFKDRNTTDQERAHIVNTLLRPSIMSVSTMNDPEEGYYIQDYLAGNLSHQRVHHNFWWDDNEEPEYIYNNNARVFCRCFSPAAHKDDLSMWEVYGDRAQGCCAVVNCDLSHLFNEELFQICYCNCLNGRIKLLLEPEPTPGSLKVIREELRNLSRIIKDLKNSTQHSDSLVSIKRAVRQLLLGIAYLFKDASYAHEKEVRYLKHYISETSHDIHEDLDFIERSYSDNKMPLLCITSPFQLVFDEVMLGPKAPEARIAATYLEYAFSLIRKYAPNSAQQFKQHTTKITKSRIKYQ